METTRPYPLKDVLLTSIVSKHDEIIIPHKAVDCSFADTTHSSACNTPLNKVYLVDTLGVTCYTLPPTLVNVY